MFHPRTPHPWIAAILALALAAAPGAAQQGGAPAPTPAASSTTDSAKAPASGSRFGRFGRAFRKAASGDTAAAEAAVRAMTDLVQISARAQQHDAAAVHALRVLSAALGGAAP